MTTTEPTWRTQLIADIGALAGAEFTNDELSDIASLCALPIMHRFVMDPDMWPDGPLKAIHDRIKTGEITEGQLRRLLCTDPIYMPTAEPDSPAHSAEAIAAVSNALRAEGLDEREGTVHSWRCYHNDDTLVGDCDCMDQLALQVLDSLARAEGTGAVAGATAGRE